MDKKIFLENIKNELVLWCEKESSNGNINFKKEFCTGKTYIRFTTNFLITIMKPSNYDNGPWNNGNFIFYEINNRDKKISVSCVIGKKDMPGEYIETSAKLMTIFNRRCKEDWEYKILKTWNLYKYSENENVFTVIENFSKSFNHFLNIDAIEFENKISRGLSNNFKDEKPINFYFEPVNLNKWNLFKEVKNVGQELYFLATSSMKENDILVVFVGTKTKGVDSGVYAIGKIKTNPSRLTNKPSDFCYDRLSVLVEILYVNHKTPIISKELSKNIFNQFRSVHKVREEKNELIESYINNYLNNFVEYEEINIFEDISFLEGEEVKRIIKTKKRNSKAKELKLNDFKNKHGELFCEVCGEDEECVIDVHHDKVQVSQMEENHLTKLDDLKVVCSNCHRKLHYHNLTVNELKYKI